MKLFRGKFADILFGRGEKEAGQQEYFKNQAETCYHILEELYDSILDEEINRSNREIENLFKNFNINLENFLKVLIQCKKRDDWLIEKYDRILFTVVPEVHVAGQRIQRNDKFNFLNDGLSKLDNILKNYLSGDLFNECNSKIFDLMKRETDE